MKDFIVWFKTDCGEYEDYMVIKAETYGEALDRFDVITGGAIPIIECHAINPAIQEHVE